MTNPDLIPRMARDITLYEEYYREQLKLALETYRFARHQWYLRFRDEEFRDGGYILLYLREKRQIELLRWLIRRIEEKRG